MKKLNLFFVILAVVSFVPCNAGSKNEQSEIDTDSKVEGLDEFDFTDSEGRTMPVGDFMYYLQLVKRIDQEEDQEVEQDVQGVQEHVARIRTNLENMPVSFYNQLVNKIKRRRGKGRKRQNKQSKQNVQPVKKDTCSPDLSAIVQVLQAINENMTESGKLQEQALEDQKQSTAIAQQSLDDQKAANEIAEQEAKTSKQSLDAQIKSTSFFKKTTLGGILITALTFLGGIISTILTAEASDAMC